MKHAKIFIGCLMIILNSCSINEKSAPKTVTGTLVPGHEVRSFSEEGRPKSYWVVDKTGKLMSEYKKAAADSIINATPVLAELTVEEAPQMPDGFGADYDGTYNVLKIVSITPLRVSLSGSRTEPVPGLAPAQQGFLMKSDGRASSINMATLQYQKWRPEGNKLILSGKSTGESGKSTGNRQTIDFVDSYVIEDIGLQKLVLRKNNKVFTFHKQP